MFGRAIKMNLANEGLEARKKEEEVATRKRKAEDDKKWEGEPCDPQIVYPTLPWIFMLIFTVRIHQKTENNASTAGVHSPKIQRRRRNRRSMSSVDPILVISPLSALHYAIVHPLP